jgi:hypothetical protein
VLATALLAPPADGPLPAVATGIELGGLFDERAAHLVPPAARERSKKETWLADKSGRRDLHLTDAALRRRLARAPAVPVTTLYNVWTREALPLLPDRPIGDRFHPFLRDHYTNQATRMDLRLVDVLTRVATRFNAPRIEVVSGYRSPKYNLMLRKKGREVARSSQHTEGNAVDFRVRGVPTPVLLRFVRSLRQGGVGFYPRSQFVHSDTGRVRFWKGS